MASKACRTPVVLYAIELLLSGGEVYNGTSSFEKFYLPPIHPIAWAEVSQEPTGTAA